MRFECRPCGAAYEIPDSRIPKGKRKITFPCLVCKQIIRAEVTPGSGSIHVGDNEAPPPSRGEAEKKRSNLLRGLKALPAIPQVVFQAQQIMADPDTGIKELADTLETDQAIVAMILRMANSAYYGFAGKVASIKHAATLLGHNVIGEIIAMAGVSNALNRSMDGYGMPIGALWRHSICVAFGARLLVSESYPDLAEDAFITGLLHDIGKLILNPHINEQNAEGVKLVRKSGRQTLIEAEQDLFGFDHAEIGADACGKWHIPQRLIEAIRHHHDPIDAQMDLLAYVVHAADILSVFCGRGGDLDGILYRFDPKAMQILNLDAKKIGYILSKTSEAVENIACQDECF